MDCEETLILDAVTVLEKSGQLTRLKSLLFTFMAEEPDADPEDGLLNESFVSTSSTSCAKQKRILKFEPNFDLMQIANISPKLGLFIQSDVNRFKTMLQDVVHQFAQHSCSFGWLDRDQIHVEPKICNLAFVTEHHSKEFAPANAVLARQGALWTASGKVFAISQQVKYISSTSYICINSDCVENREDTAYVKLRGYLDDSGQFANSPKQCCGSCGHPLEEQVNNRDVSVKVPGLVILEDSAKRHYFSSQTVLEKRGNSFRALMEVLNVVTSPDPFEGFIKLNGGSILLPNSIGRLYKENANSPWSFVYNLANFFMKDLFRCENAFQLTVGLLLSIVGPKDQPLSIFATGNSTRDIERIMLKLCHFTRGRSAVLLSESGKDKKAAKDEFPMFITLPDHIVYLGEFNQTKADIIMNKNKTSLEREVAHQSTVAGYWSFISSQERSKHQARLIKDAIESFGMMIHVQDIEEDYISMVMANSNDGQCGAYQEIELDDYSIFLNQVRHIVPEVRSSAEDLICNYFGASRMIRSSNSDGSELPRSALKALLALAEGHAKLSLRNEVTDDDAAFACFYYEEMLYTTFGYSFLDHEDAMRRKSCGDRKSPDERLREFQRKLEDGIYGNHVQWEE